MFSLYSLTVYLSLFPLAFSFLLYPAPSFTAKGACVFIPFICLHSHPSSLVHQLFCFLTKYFFHDYLTHLTLHYSGYCVRRNSSIIVHHSYYQRIKALFIITKSNFLELFRECFKEGWERELTSLGNASFWYPYIAMRNCSIY